VCKRRVNENYVAGALDHKGDKAIAASGFIISIYAEHQFLLRKMLGTRYGPVGIRFLSF